MHLDFLNPNIKKQILIWKYKNFRQRVLKSRYSLNSLIYLNSPVIWKVCVLHKPHNEFYSKGKIHFRRSQVKLVLKFKCVLMLIVQTGKLWIKLINFVNRDYTLIFLRFNFIPSAAIWLFNFKFSYRLWNILNLFL